MSGRSGGKGGRRAGKAAGIGLAVAILVGACASVPPTTYYVMPYATPAAPLCSEPMPLVLGVPGFEAGMGRDRTALAFRPSAYRLGFYSYREWLSRPDRLLTEMLVRALVDSGCFGVVQSPPYGGAVDFELSGVLDRIEEVEAPGKWSAGLGWRLLLADEDGLVLWRDRTDRERPAASNEPEAVVAAMTQIVNDEMPRLVRAVRDAIVQEMRQGSDEDEEPEAAPSVEDEGPSGQEPVQL